MNPTLAQMRMALRTNPLDLQSIGANEAPTLSPKVYMSPNRTTDTGMPPPGGVATRSGMPIGGIDMSKQPGQQLMPQAAPQQAPQAPQPPQGAQPPGTQPTPGNAPSNATGNILQMTPQGRAMTAMNPQQTNQLSEGGQPQLADGGQPSRYAIKPYYNDNEKRIGWALHDGDYLHDVYPTKAYATKIMKQWIEEDKKKNNPQGMADGGQKKEKAPVLYPASRPISDKELAAHAERIARQIMGESNPNEKTQQQLKREQNMPVDIRMQGTEKKRPVINYEMLKNAILMGIPGDPSIGGLLPSTEEKPHIREAAAMLHGIGGRQFENPVPLYGGAKYGAYGNPSAWAGNISAARALQNAAKALAHEEPESKVYGQYVKMTPQSLDYALHNLDALLEHQQTHKLPQEIKDAVTHLMKHETTAGHQPFPAFSGLDDPAEVLLHAQMDSNLRKKLVHLLSTKKYVPTGKQDWDDVIYAISHPELRNLETGSGGQSILEMKPHEHLQHSEHPTYSHDIPSELIGQSRYPVPHQVAYPRTHQYAQEAIAKMGKKVVPFNQMKMMGMREKIDEQYINQLGKYEQEMRKRLGYKKGGQVNQDTMLLALTKRKKAK